MYYPTAGKAVCLLRFANKKPRFRVAFYMAPRVGLEPTTYRLTAGRSTIELSGKNLFFKTSHPCYIFILVNLFYFVNTFLFPDDKIGQKSSFRRAQTLKITRPPNTALTVSSVFCSPAASISAASASTHRLSTV